MKKAWVGDQVEAEPHVDFDGLGWIPPPITYHKPAPERLSSLELRIWKVRNMKLWFYSLNVTVQTE